MNPMHALHVALCLVLFWTCWQRVWKMTRRTHTPVRVAFVYGASTSLLLAASPWLWHVWPWFPAFEPHPAVLAVLLAVDAFQLSTARYWRTGVPGCFERKERSHA